MRLKGENIYNGALRTEHATKISLRIIPERSLPMMTEGHTTFANWSTVSRVDVKSS